jgi:sterol 3beta-glucosyltransferase
MNVLILTLGSRGDVQPYVALGGGLQKAGHTVKLATTEQFGAFVREHCLEFAPLNGEFLKLIDTSEGKAAVAGKGGALKLMQAVKPLMRRMMDEAWSAAGDSDVVLYHPKALGGYSIAEKLGVPPILALPAPLYSPTDAFPSPLLPFENLGGMLNRASHRITIWLASVSMRGTVNQWRKKTLGLPSLKDELTWRGRPVLRLYPYSPAVLAMPPDWDGRSVATGYWFLDRPRDWEPPASLLAFLRAGPPPVYVGFGSMPSQDAGRVTHTVLEALDRAGQRGVLATGWGGLVDHDLPTSIYALTEAPHDWLFPQMAAVVHHGGAGTTAAGLRAGVPTVICPFFGDQPFWGRRVAALGAGPQPIPQRRLTVEALRAAMSAAVSDTAMRERAARIGQILRAEDGVGQAVVQIEAYVGLAAEQVL